MCTCRVRLLFSFHCYRTWMSIFCFSLPAYVRSQLYDDNNVLEAAHSRIQTETTVSSNASKRPHAFVIVDANGNENDEKREFIAADSIDQYTVRADDWSPSESELTVSRLAMPIGIVDITSMRLRENDPLCVKYLQFMQLVERVVMQHMTIDHKTVALRQQRLHLCIDARTNSAGQLVPQLREEILSSAYSTTSINIRVPSDQL